MFPSSQFWAAINKLTGEESAGHDHCRLRVPFYVPQPQPFPLRKAPRQWSRSGDLQPEPPPPPPQPQHASGWPSPEPVAPVAINKRFRHSWAAFEQPKASATAQQIIQQQLYHQGRKERDVPNSISPTAPAVLQTRGPLPRTRKCPPSHIPPVRRSHRPPVHKVLLPSQSGHSNSNP